MIPLRPLNRWYQLWKQYNLYVPLPVTNCFATQTAGLVLQCGSWKSAAEFIPGSVSSKWAKAQATQTGKTIFAGTLDNFSDPSIEILGMAEAKSFRVLI